MKKRRATKRKWHQPKRDPKLIDLLAESTLALNPQPVTTPVPVIITTNP